MEASFKIGARLGIGAEGMFSTGTICVKLGKYVALRRDMERDKVGRSTNGNNKHIYENSA